MKNIDENLTKLLTTSTFAESKSSSPLTQEQINEEISKISKDATLSPTDKAKAMQNIIGFNYKQFEKTKHAPPLPIIMPVSPISDRDRLGNELWTAAKEWNLEKVMELVAIGAYVNWTDKAGRTPLMLAASGSVLKNEGGEAVVQFLLHSNASTDVQDLEKGYAAAFACHFKYKKVASLLLTYGANFNMKLSYGATAKTYVEMHGWNLEEMERKAFSLSPFYLNLIFLCAMNKNNKKRKEEKIEEQKEEMSKEEEEEKEEEVISEEEKRKKEEGGVEKNSEKKKKNLLFFIELINFVHNSDLFFTEGVLPLLFSSI